MLGDGGVTESNLMLYLGIIEQRTNEILQMYAIHMVRHVASIGAHTSHLSYDNNKSDGEHNRWQAKQEWNRPSCKAGSY
jgi:hypothetical protein